MANLLHGIGVCEKTDDAEMVKILLDRDSDVINYTWRHDAREMHNTYKYSVPARERLSALIIATESQRPKKMKLLLEKGGDVDLRDKRGRTALIITCRDSQNQLSELLVKKRADLDSTGEYALLH